MHQFFVNISQTLLYEKNKMPSSNFDKLYIQEYAEVLAP